ncbi:hypothetical protein NFI96_011291 [Prochilodus magdalenae]|nr:hypothetical protein NFI96_011291 [Prochilodus magdalenae]
MDSSGGFTKFRWICTVIGLFCSLADIGSDLLVSVQYFKEGLYIWFGLTLSFMLIASLCAHIFSYVWFEDDRNQGPENVKLSKPCMVVVHLLQMGFITRYFNLLKESYKSVWLQEFHQNSRNIFYLVADLSMLRLFETFLESVPQLLLQLYIVLQHQHTSVIQYICMAISFLNIAWTTMDYWRCLRRTLTNSSEMPSGFPLAVYLLYKVLTISARILSLTLLIMLNIYNILALVFIWLMCVVWAHVVNTEFCTSLCLECLYRATVGFIMIFTFFNIKGKNTKLPMTVYYIISTLQNLSAPVFLFLFRPRTLREEHFLPIMVFILVANTTGLVFLVLYYTALHPNSNRVSDVVDGSGFSQSPMSTATRLNRFLNI